MEPARMQEPKSDVWAENPELPTLIAQANCPNVLVAHPDAQMRCRLAAVLRRDGYRVDTVTDGIELLDWLADRLLEAGTRGMPQVIVADIGLPGRRGIDILADLRYSGLSTPFVFTARSGDDRMIADAGKMGPVSVFSEPFEIDDFRTSVYCHAPPDKSRTVLSSPLPTIV